MKLIRLSQGDAKPRFGVVIGDRAVAFSSLQQRSGGSRPDLNDSRSYLAGLPATERAARELAAWGEAHWGDWPEAEKPKLQDVRLHEPVEVRYQGSTSEIDHQAEDVFAWLGFISFIQPGTVVGMGTIPDCTGLDHDDFLDPGAEIEIGIERLGSLHCRFAEPARKLLPSRWPLRPALQKYHA